MWYANSISKCGNQTIQNIQKITVVKSYRTTNRNRTNHEPKSQLSRMINIRILVMCSMELHRRKWDVTATEPLSIIPTISLLAFGYLTRLVPWNTALGPRMGSNPVEGSIPPRCGYLQLKFAPSREWSNPCLHCCPERCIVIVYFIFHPLRRCRQSYGPSCSSYYPCWQYYCSYLNLIHFSAHLAGVIDIARPSLP